MKTSQTSELTYAVFKVLVLAERSSSSKNKTRNDTAHTCLAEKVFGEGGEVRALAAEATVKLKILDDTTDAQELVTVMCKYCKVDVATAVVGLLNCPAGTRYRSYRENNTWTRGVSMSISTQRKVVLGFKGRLPFYRTIGHTEDSLVYHRCCGFSFLG